MFEASENIEEEGSDRWYTAAKQRNVTMNESDEKIKPDCFGDLNTVFPLRSDGFRVTPDSCLRCIHKTSCLRSAMSGRNGLQIREEMIDRAYRGGVIGFFQRWSQKKSIQQMRKEDPSAS